jgi:sulfonate transport system permease protein
VAGQSSDTQSYVPDDGLKLIVYDAKVTDVEAARRARRRRVLETVLAVAVPVAALAFWQLASSQRWIDPILYPAPSKIGSSGISLIRDGSLLRNIDASTVRILSGFAIGAVGGLVVGIPMGSIRFLRHILEPTLNGLYVVPKLAILPVFFSIFGFGDAPKIALVAVTVFFFVWLQAMASVASIPQGFRDAATAMGVGRVQMFGHVTWPYALPQLVVSMRISMGVAVLVTTAAEFISGTSGLGYLIFHSQELFLLDQSYVGIVTVALLGVVLSGLVVLAGRALTPWEDRSSK